MEPILENVRIIRESKGYSQEQVADILKMSQSKYARFERGAIKTDLDLLKKVANLFEMSLIDLISYHEKAKNADSSVTATPISEDPTKVVLQIEQKKKKKDQVLKLIFGENNLEIFNK